MESQSLFHCWCQTPTECQSPLTVSKKLIVKHIFIYWLLTQPETLLLFYCFIVLIVLHHYCFYVLDICSILIMCSTLFQLWLFFFLAQSICRWRTYQSLFVFFWFFLCQIISAPGPHTFSSEFLVERIVQLPSDTFTVSTDPISAGQTCWLRMLVRQLPASIIPVRAMILHRSLSWSLWRMPLKPIIFLQLLTYTQFVLREFGKDAISEPASRFPGQKSAKRQQTTDSNSSDAQEKARGWKTSEVCTRRENTMLPCIAT